MNNRIPIKVTFASVSMVLFSLGAIGIYAGVSNGDVTKGVFGFISVGLGIATSIWRNLWNEGWWNKNGKTQDGEEADR